MTTDLQTKIAKIIYGTWGLTYASWDRAQLGHRQICEQAADEIVKLLKPVGVDRKKRAEILQAVRQYGIRNDLEYLDRVMALIDAIAPVKIPTRSQLNTMWGTMLTSASGRDLIEKLIAAGFATEDDEPYRDSNLVGPEFGYKFTPSSTHIQAGIAGTWEPTPHPADASEDEREQLHQIIFQSGPVTPTVLRDAILAEGFRRQPTAASSEREELARTLYEHDTDCGWDSLKHEGVIAQYLRKADTILTAGFRRQPTADSGEREEPEWREPETLGEAICDSYYYIHNYAITFLEGELDTWNAIADYLVEHHGAILTAGYRRQPSVPMMGRVDLVEDRRWTIGPQIMTMIQKLVEKAVELGGANRLEISGDVDAIRHMIDYVVAGAHFNWLPIPDPPVAEPEPNFEADFDAMTDAEVEKWLDKTTPNWESQRKWGSRRGRGVGWTVWANYHQFIEPTYSEAIRKLAKAVQMDKGERG